MNREPLNREPLPPTVRLHVHKTVWSPDELGAQAGDVVHVRRAGWCGAAVRRCLGSWGDHDGTLVHIGAERQKTLGLDWRGWAVAEALPPRFTLTPWSAYFRAIEENRKRVCFLRPPNAPVLVRLNVEDMAFTMLHRSYDRWAGVGHAVQVLIRANREWSVPWEWPCTASVAEQWLVSSQVLGWHDRFCPWLDNLLPTPYTTEKRWRQGRLDLVRPAPDAAPDFGTQEMERFWERQTQSVRSVRSDGLVGWPEPLTVNR